MSLADELLADLEEAGDDEGEQPVEDEAAGDDIMDAVDDVDDDMDTKYESVTQIAKLHHSTQLKKILSEIEKYLSKPQRMELKGVVEADPEYLLIVEANNITVEIDNEINIIHKYVRDHYAKRFPELESLVHNALEYMATVKELGNDLDKTKSSEKLQEILTSATIMIVSVSASTTQGEPLDDGELKAVVDACDMAYDLNRARLQILDYVESRMALFSPNLSILIGSATAAKLMSVAGGLTDLSKTPACNVLLLGAQKKTLSGFSSTAIMPHTGFIYYSPMVQNCPPDLRRKVARLIAAKCALAARVDSFHESHSGEAGMSMKEDVEKKLDKLLEPPPVKQVKALPKPIEVTGKKRGGRRVRKMKERLGMTEMRKHANRMNFGQIEEDAYQEDLGVTLGSLGKETTGRVRGPQVNKESNARLSKAQQKKLASANAFGNKTVFGGRSTVRGQQTSGIASSVAFTPLQGLEIVNPNAAEKKVSDADAKYFSSTSGFRTVLKRTT